MDLNWTNFWFQIKGLIEDELGIVRDQMHVHFGLLVFLSVAVLLRNRRNGQLVAWSIVAGIQAMNEAFDARDWINWTGSVNWVETAKDSASTLFWPTVLLLIWRWIGARKTSRGNVEPRQSHSLSR